MKKNPTLDENKLSPEGDGDLCWFDLEAPPPRSGRGGPPQSHVSGRARMCLADLVSIVRPGQAARTIRVHRRVGKVAEEAVDLSFHGGRTQQYTGLL